MKGQLNLFEPEFIKDIDCTVDTPVTRGNKDKPIYGTGKRIKPRVPGRRETKHMEEIYLEELLPLEEYDLIVVLISGGKDSIATYFKLRELGVPKSKIEFWHHDIDGGNPERHMDLLQIMIDFAGPSEEGKPPKPKFIDAVYIDEDGTIKTIRDEAWCFQFVRRNGGAADGKTNNNA